MNYIFRSNWTTHSGAEHFLYGEQYNSEYVEGMMKLAKLTAQTLNLTHGFVAFESGGQHPTPIYYCAPDSVDGFRSWNQNPCLKQRCTVGKSVYWIDVTIRGGIPAEKWVGQNEHFNVTHYFPHGNWSWQFNETNGQAPMLVEFEAEFPLHGVDFRFELR